MPPSLETLLEADAWLTRLARSLAVDPGTGDDVAQEARLVALTRGPDAPGASRSWLRRVVANLVSNRRRAARRRAAHEEAASREARRADEATHDVVARWEIRRRVVEAVLELDEPYRATVLLRFFEGLTVPETAARMRVPVETVRTRSRRALDVLRGRLAAFDERLGRRGLALLLLAGPEARGSGEPLAAAPHAAVSHVAMGGALMALGAKWGAAAVAALAIAGILIWGVADRGTSSRSGRGGFASVESDAARERTGRAARPGDEPRDAVSAVAETGLDLDACDRERDVHGIVLSPGGEPVAGAHVAVFRRRPWGEVLNRPREDRVVRADATVTDAGGKFAVRLEPGADVAVEIDAPPYALYTSAYRQAGERMTVRLAPATDLLVRVHDRLGVALRGATVRLGRYVSDDSPLPAIADSGADGVARFDRLPQGMTASVSIDAAGHVRASRELTVGTDRTQIVDIVLEPGRTVRGVVVDAGGGVPVEGAHVALASSDPFPVATTAGGRFELAGVAHRAELHAFADGYAPGFAVAEGDDVRIALTRAAVLTGRVVDRAAVPVADADVVVISVSRSPTQSSSLGAARAGRDGRFRVGGLATECMHLLRIQAPGRARLYRGAWLPSRPGAVDLGDIVLDAPHRVRGTVVTADGAPCPRVRVGISGAGADSNLVPHDHRWTDDLGRFTFQELAHGTYVLQVRNRTGEVRVDVPVDGDPAPVVLRPTDAPTLTPPLRHAVTVRVSTEDGSPLPALKACLAYSANGATTHVPVGPDGVVRVEAAFTPHRVSLSLDGTESAQWLPAYADLRPGQTEAEIVLRRAATIRGRVVGRDGALPPYSFVEMFDGARQIGGASVDADGRFALAVEPGARVDLQASAGHAPNDLSREVGWTDGVSAGAEDVVIRLVVPKSRSLDVLVVDADGEPVVGASAHVSFVGADDWRPTIATTDADGHAMLRDVPATPVVVQVDVPVAGGGLNDRWGPPPVRTVASGDRLTVRLGAPRTIRGRVLQENGVPCGGAFVHTLGQGGNCRTLADADGRFTLVVSSEEPLPCTVGASPFPFDPKAPKSGHADCEDPDAEFEIIVLPVPGR